MKGFVNRICIAILAAGLTAAWAQHGHGAGGAGGAGGHGAPPQFTPARTSTAGTGAAAAGSTAQTANVTTRLANNPALSARIQPLLPAGTNVSSAAAGFRNQGRSEE